MATTVLTKGHIFIHITDVRAPVNAVQVAITTSIPLHIRYTSRLAGFCEPVITVTRKASRPIKHKVIPSAAHSMVIILVLSADRSPNPLTTDGVGMIWAIPQMKIMAEPIYNKMSTLPYLLK
jgi:hypothetical protein